MPTLAANSPLRRTIYPRPLTALLLVAFLLNYIDRQVIFSVFPLLQTDFRLSPSSLTVWEQHF